MEKFYMDLDEYAYRSIPFANKTLMAGFTTVRELGGVISNSLRDAINAGYVDGPRIFSAGKSIATTGGHADPSSGLNMSFSEDLGPKDGVINGPSDARKAVRQRYKNGADLIKITATGGVLSLAKNSKNPQFSEQEIKAIVETAQDYDMHVAAHAHGPEGMKRAIKAGVHSIEHGTIMDGEVLALMKKYGTYYVPTISAGMFVAEKARISGYYPPIIVPKALEIGPRLLNTFTTAYKFGIKIAFGTDSGVSYHGDNAKEFLYMVKGGMTEMEAIRSATIVASEMLGISNELGSVESGKLADIIAVEGNPIKDITALQRVVFVMKEGKIYKPIK
jgi:imidazolonepropionase-like amidohydrolase